MVAYSEDQAGIAYSEEGPDARRWRNVHGRGDTADEHFALQRSLDECSHDELERYRNPSRRGQNKAAPAKSAVDANKSGASSGQDRTDDDVDPDVDGDAVGELRADDEWAVAYAY